MNYDDETLMAYADGELDAARRAQIAAAIEKDPALARRVEQHRALRAQVAGAFATVLEQPVPERLRAAAAEGAAAPRGNVLKFPARAARAPSPPWRAREWTAMAASLVLGVLIAWRVIAPPDSLMTAGRDGLVARGALAAALETQLASAQRADDAVLIGLTFRAQDGSFCRSFSSPSTGTAGLACRAGGEWRLPVTTSVPAGEGGLQPAASAMPPAVLQVIQARIAGEPLDAEAERSAHRAGWAEKE